LSRPNPIALRLRARRPLSLAAGVRLTQMMTILGTEATIRDEKL